MINEHFRGRCEGKTTLTERKTGGRRQRPEELHVSLQCDTQFFYFFLSDKHIFYQERSLVHSSWSQRDDFKVLKEQFDKDHCEICGLKVAEKHIFYILWKGMEG